MQIIIFLNTVPDFIPDFIIVCGMISLTGLNQIYFVKPDFISNYIILAFQKNFANLLIVKKDISAYKILLK